MSKNGVRKANKYFGTTNFLKTIDSEYPSEQLDTPESGRYVNQEPKCSK